jgi:ApbE superfamily uncharacterized protein (UPF0280 family)
VSAPDIVILPEQAAKIAKVAAVTGTAIGVSQSGSTLILDTGRLTIVIDAGGNDIPPPNQERLLC